MEKKPHSGEYFATQSELSWDPSALLYFSSCLRSTRRRQGGHPIASHETNSASAEMGAYLCARMLVLDKTVRNGNAHSQKNPIQPPHSNYHPPPN